MANDNQELSGAAAGTPPEPPKEPSPAAGIEALPESWQKEIRDLRKEAEKYRLEKKNLEAAQAAETEKKLKEQGEFKTLFEALKTETDRVKQELTEKETKLNAVIESRR